MVEMVETRRNAETKEEHHDLFSGLLDAARDDFDGNARITEQELICKCYLSYLIAHEKVLICNASEYAHLPSCRTRGRSTTFRLWCDLNRPSTTDDIPHTLFHVRLARALSR